MANVKLDDERLSAIAQITGSFNAFVKATENLADDNDGRKTFDRLYQQYFLDIPVNEVERSAIINKQAINEQLSYQPHNTLGQIVGKITGIYWATSGHTSVPVITAAVGPGHELFRGYYDNTDFAKKLYSLTGVTP